MSRLLENDFSVLPAAFSTVEPVLEEGAGQTWPFSLAAVSRDPLAILTPLFQVHTIVHDSLCRQRCV